MIYFKPPPRPQFIDVCSKHLYKYNFITLTSTWFYINVKLPINKKKMIIIILFFLINVCYQFYYGS